MTNQEQIKVPETLGNGMVSIRIGELTSMNQAYELMVQNTKKLQAENEQLKKERKKEK
jgi:hypothetical protein